MFKISMILTSSTVSNIALTVQNSRSSNAFICLLVIRIVKKLLVDFREIWGISRVYGIVREFCKPGKVREFEIWSGNFL